jgi:uncharacterized membrane protein
MIVGQYNDSSNSYGFLYKNENFTTISFPGGQYTVAYSINSNGAIVGYYTDSVGAGHGFLQSNGVFSSFDFPDAYTTFAYGINDAGAIAGAYDDLTVVHGFIFSGGVFTTVDVPEGQRLRCSASRTTAMWSASLRIVSASTTASSVNRRLV